MIKRTILPTLLNHLTQKEITIIVGPRQAGKTTLMNIMKTEVTTQGYKAIFLNLDNERDKSYFNSQEILLNYLKLQFGTEKGYVFIDEIQRKENAGLLMKGIYDLENNYKFILSGSGSLELKEKTHESLAGRKQLFEIGTISFEEFIHYKTDYKYQNNLQDFFEHDHYLPVQLLGLYLQFGGYPRVIIAETLEQKLSVISEIYNSYIEKDIQNLLQIKKTESFSDLVTLLASQSGKIVKHSELSSITGLDIETVKNYIWYLKKTFILQKVSPYFNNTRKEIIKSPIYYFKDLGLRNYAYNRFSYINLLTEGGFLFQNLVSLLLSKFSFDQHIVVDTKLNYWRTKGGAEIDFIVSAGIEKIPVEVKFKDLKKGEITKSIHSFIAEYNPKKVIIINKSYSETIVKGSTTIYIIPYYKLLTNNYFE